MADYGLEDRRFEIEPARPPRWRAGSPTSSPAATPSRPRFVAGSIGPTDKTASIVAERQRPRLPRRRPSTSWSPPTPSRSTAWSQGGVDILFPETSFDTLNLKACLFAIDQYFERHGVRLPVMVSGTITDKSGRTLSGQTIEAFWHSVSHFDML